MLRHSIDLQELALHRYLERSIGLDIPATFAITPEKIRMGADLMAYYVWSSAASRISTCKVNFKALLRALQYRWRARGVEVELSVSMNLCADCDVLKCTPQWQATRIVHLLELGLSIASPVRYHLHDADNFDPWLLVNRERWLFDLPA